MIVEIYRKIIPLEIRSIIARVRFFYEKRDAYNKVLSGQYKKYKAECEYMKNIGKITTFPYSFTEKYDYRDIAVYDDSNKKMKYVKIGGAKKLYFPKRWSKSFIKKYFNAILCEQDPDSPHHYFDEDSRWLTDTVFIDVGSAEGYMALLVADKVKKIIILECDTEWREALEATFEEYKHKVRILSKYAGMNTEDNMIRLDDVVEDDDSSVIVKMDVEGAEYDVLKGANNIMNNKRARFFVCVYHGDQDETIIRKYVEENGLKAETSEAVMFYRFGTEKNYSFRHGVLRCFNY